ncbi:MAG: M81 family metallopeptidase [Betaproteobacteria bacterium]|nr:M81 family metallopeptidase [Betaproteobacteria bacterium]
MNTSRNSQKPRIAVGTFMLESNAHSPVATREEFAQNYLMFGDEMADDWQAEHPRGATCMSGFVDGMNASGEWAPLPLIGTMVGASGPIDQTFFDEVVREMTARLKAVMPVDGVFLSLHGAAIGTVEVDPDGVLLEAIRKIVGPDIPIIATLDLHANVSAKMVANADVLVVYRTNPHIDMFERGQESAALMREIFAGEKATAAFVKLPFIPPSVTQNTKSGPYADIIAYGQSKVDSRVMNVSVVSGFSLGDTVKNGMSVIVTTRNDAALAKSLATNIAQRTWDERHRYIPKLTTIDEATRMALTCGRESSRPALLFADVADNPGGGGRGNTVWILKAFHEAGVEGALLGVFFDPELAKEAHDLGKGATFHAQFNRNETHLLSGKFAADVVVEALHDGNIVGRRGISAGHQIILGPMALLKVGGIRVVVISVRQQCKDTAMFEVFGIDIAKARAVIVKSRGHFRAAFDLLFPDERIIEVDVPGLTTPILSRVPYKNVPRPIFPLDADTEWVASAG